MGYIVALKGGLLMDRTFTVPNKPSKIGQRLGSLLQANLRCAKQVFGASLAPRLSKQLKSLTRDFSFSVDAGELQIINGGWYVTHTGLVRLARRKHCRGIHVEAVDSLCDLN